MVFNLPENALTAQESKDIYLRVLDPQGAVVANDATGSGEFEVDGAPSKFTARESVAYQNNNQKVEMLYDNSQLRPGKYRLNFIQKVIKSVEQISRSSNNSDSVLRIKNRAGLNVRLCFCYIRIMNIIRHQSDF